MLRGPVSRPKASRRARRGVHLRRAGSSRWATVRWREGPREPQWSGSSSCGGPVGSGWVRGREGRPRIFRATLGWVTSARTRRLPPQGQSKTSNPQVRRNNWAQSSLGRTGGFRGTASVASSFSWAPVGVGSGSGGSGGRGRRACATSSWEPDSQRASSSGPWASPPADTGASSTVAASAPARWLHWAPAS